MPKNKVKVPDFADCEGYIDVDNYEELPATEEVIEDVSEDVSEEVRPFPLKDFNDIEEHNEQQWLIEDLIPASSDGTAGYIFGQEKARKSFLASEIILGVVTGKDVLNYFRVCSTGTVVVFSAEGGQQEFKRRLARLARGAGLEISRERLLVIDIARLRLDDEGHQLRLKATLEAIPDLRLIVLDPMVRMHGGNDNRAEELAPIHNYLRELVNNIPKATLLLVHHMNKSGGARGSSDYPAFGEFNLYVTKRNTTESRVASPEFRTAPAGQPFFFSIEDGVDDSGAPTMTLAHRHDCSDIQARTDTSDEAKDRVFEYVTENPKATNREVREWIRDEGFSASNGKLAGWIREARNSETKE